MVLRRAPGFTAAASWGVFYDRVVKLPMRVAAADIATLTFDVPADLAAPYFPLDVFRPVLAGNGTAQLLVSMADYRRTDWKPSRGVTVGFLACPVTAPDRLGLFAYRLAVNDPLSLEVGRGLMDDPVSVELIEVHHTPEETVFSLAVGVHPTLELRLPNQGPERGEGRMDLDVYSYRDGVGLLMPVELDVPAELPVDAPGLRFTLGNGPYADELRRLHLSGRPSSCTWGRNLTASFHGPQPVG